MWNPELSEDGRPRYEAIADAIARDIGRGALTTGQRLPTHRDLAQTLGVTVGTVSRAYAEAKRRGLTIGEVGRGTFVQGMRSVDEFLRGADVPPEQRDETVELGLALPWSQPGGEDGSHLAATLDAIARDSCADALLRYQPDSASLKHRTSAANWLQELGVNADPDRVVLTTGSQHGLLVALSAVLAPGDVLLTGELSYPGIKSLARMLGIRLRGVPMDEEGILPEELDRIATETSAQAVYCIPTFQNPTCSTMSEERRVSVADVAWQRGLLVLEDDLYAPLADHGHPTLASLAPERTLFLASFSKAVTFGLRVGMIAAPANLLERLRATIRASVWMPPPLMIEVAMRWVEDGTARTLMSKKLEELAARHEIVIGSLGRRAEVRGNPRSLHSWLTLPEPWRSDDFVRVASQRGIGVAGAEVFAVGRGHVPHAIRVSAGPEPDRDRFQEAIEGLAEILDGPAECCGDIV